MTVAELVEKLKEFPQNCEVKIKREWFSDGDYDYGLNEYTYNDIDNILAGDDDNKSVTIYISD